MQASRLVLVTSGALALSVLAFEGCQNPVQPAPTRQQAIESRWADLKPAYSGTDYASAPVTTGPGYAAGTLSAGFLQDGLNMVNFARFLAGLPDDIVEDATLGDEAQHGALLMAVDNTIVSPANPGDMDASFYSEASTAVGQSLVSMGYSTLPDAVRAFMSESAGNILSRRRWILNPQMQKTGLGFSGNGTADFADMLPLDTSRASTFDYDYTAWPAAGAFPVQFYSSTSPWSVTLNPSRYQAPVAANITVAVRRASDGKVWLLSSADTNTAGPYLAVDTSPAGVGNCIMFLPDSAVTVAVGDEYTVLVAGLKKIDGSDTSVYFTVDFFDLP